MSEDQFLKLFNHMNKRFDELRTEMDDRFDAMDQNFSHLQSTVDAIAKQQETDQEERLVMTHQLDRHEQWITNAAKKLNIRYERAS